MTTGDTLNQQASGTALATAFMRALAACDPNPAARGSDNLAEIFLPEEQKRPLKDPVARAWVLQNKVAPGAYAFMYARTAYFDRIAAQALKENLAQLVFLGAGYDSRPYRFERLIAGTRLFELDTLPTQQRKQECLRLAGVSISSHIRYVAVDFESDNLAEKMVASGYNPNDPALLIWEGVSYYLSPEAVDRMLAFVCTNAPAGSSICLDYAALSADALNGRGARELRDHMRSQYAGEPTRFGILAGEIEPFLSSRGFELVEHLTAAEISARYLPLESSPEIGSVPALFCFVHARVKRI